MLKIAPEYIHTYVTSITFDTYMHLILNTYQSKKKTNKYQSNIWILYLYFD